MLLRFLLTAACARAFVRTSQRGGYVVAARSVAAETRSLAAAVEDYDAVVVGCGPAGLAAAIELKRRGFDKVAAVERRDAPDEFEAAKA